MRRDTLTSDFHAPRRRSGWRLRLLLAVVLAAALLPFAAVERAGAFTGPPERETTNDLHDPMTLAAEDNETYVTYASTPSATMIRCNGTASPRSRPWVPYIWHGSGETLALTNQCVDGDALPNGPGGWANQSGEVWAPTVVFWGGRYVMYYTAQKAGTNQRCLGIAFSNLARGPFTANPTSIGCPDNGRWSLDPDAFKEGGNLYLVWRDDFQGPDNDRSAISAMQMDAGGWPRYDTRRTLLQATSVGYSGPTPFENKYIIENPTLIRVSVNNTLYLFFSAYAWSSGNYVTGIANCGGNLLDNGCVLTNAESYFASAPASVSSVKQFPAGANDDPGAAAMAIFRTHGGSARVVWAYMTNYPFGDPKLRSIKAGVLSYASGSGFTIT